jgi:hypothetical protein
MNIFRAFLNLLGYIFAFFAGLFWRKPQDNHVQFQGDTEETVEREQIAHRRNTPAFGLFNKLEDDEGDEGGDTNENDNGGGEQDLTQKKNSF